MFFSKNQPQLDNRQMQPGETLFEYLKRKKHIALKQSVENSFQKSRQVEKSAIHHQTPIGLSKAKIQTQRQQKPQLTKRRNKKSSNKKYSRINKSSESRKQNNSTLRNKKHVDLSARDYIDQKSTKRQIFDHQLPTLQPQIQNVASRKSGTRSFISMISPLKNKANFSQTISSQQKLTTKSVYQNKKVNQVAQNKIRKVIKDVMSKVHKKYEQQTRFQIQVKQKLRQYFILVNSVLVHLDDMNVPETLDKKSKLLRSNTKLLNLFVFGRQSDQQNERQNIATLIQEVHATVNQNLDALQGQIKAFSRHGCQQQMREIRQDYQIRIEDINKQKTRLSRQINFSNKNYQKIQREYNLLLEKYNKIQQKVQQKYSFNQQKAQLLIKQLEQKLVQINQQNFQLKETVTELTKKLKDSQYRLDQYKRNTRKQYDDKLNERESFLLKQINLLKNQCSKDVKSLSQIHVNRQDKLVIQIKAQQMTIKDQAETIEKWKNLFVQTDKNLKLIQQISKQDKKKLQSSVVDLCRINQQLYRHWLALKDIRTLLTRLSLFDKFERIYRDIPFDELLFFT